MAHDNLKGAMFPDNNAAVASMGRVYLNPADKKQNAKSPDVGGPITIDGKRYKFGAWNNVSQKGDSYLGLSLTEQADNIPF